MKYLFSKPQSSPKKTPRSPSNLGITLGTENKITQGANLGFRFLKKYTHGLPYDDSLHALGKRKREKKIYIYINVNMKLKT